MYEETKLSNSISLNLRVYVGVALEITYSFLYKNPRMTLAKCKTNSKQ